jgi:hypothetical protein
VLRNIIQRKTIKAIARPVPNETNDDKFLLSSLLELSASNWLSSFADGLEATSAVIVYGVPK